MKRSKTAPETIGERLRKSREKIGLSVGDVAVKTKMSPHIVTAIEEDNAADILSPMYVKSFLRMYARAVGLNDQALLQEFFEPQTTPPAEEARETREEPPHRAPTMPAISWGWLRRRPTKTQVRSVVGLAILVFGVMGIGAFIKFTRQHPLIAHRPSASVKVAKAKSPAPIRRKKVDTAAALPPTGFTPLTIPAHEPLKLQVLAKERAWLRVTADGNVIFQNVLEKSAIEQWSAQESLALWLGNAGSVELMLNGKSLGTPGRRGEAIKDLRITRNGMQIQR